MFFLTGTKIVTFPLNAKQLENRHLKNGSCFFAADFRALAEDFWS
jgi:hypothetical protein